ncbi:hypothetical protein BSNK01_12960 [Bacillaceae bacterium]
MTLEYLIDRFIRVKQNKPANVNELLDFMQRCYVHGELSLKEYRDLYRGLNDRGATKPEYFYEKRKEMTTA